MKNFNTFGELAVYLNTVAMHRYRENVRALCYGIGRAVQTRVEEKIGHLQPAVGNYPAWKPLAPSTVKSKGLKGHGLGGNPASPLYATGAFAKDVHFKVSDGQLHYERGWSVEIGTTTPYIVYTELGTAKMPPRPIFGPAAVETLPAFLPAVQEAAFLGLTGLSSHINWRVPGTRRVVSGIQLDVTR